MKIQIVNKQGEKVKDLPVAEKLGEAKLSPAIATLYVNYLRAAGRHPIANTLDRGEVSGGGKKPWKQKGTGNARVGSTRSPLWVHGGVTFGPTNERNFQLRINKKTRQAAICGLIGELLAAGKVIIVDELEKVGGKTKEAAEILSGLDINGKIAVIADYDQETLYRSFRNIAGVKIMTPTRLDFIYLLTVDKVIASNESFKQLSDYCLKEKSEKNNE